MAGRGWMHRWVCREEGCPAGGDGEEGKRVDRDAALHTKREGHATRSWAEPPLPIKVSR